MTAEIHPSTGLTAPRHVGLASRIYGLGSVYAKTLRDSRLSFVIVACLLGGLMVAVGAAFGTAYTTPQSRDDVVRIVQDLPAILQGLTGKAVNVGTLGGYMTYKYGPYIAMIAGLWSILALSATLAGEARRGSLEMVAASPFGKRQLALEKLAGHVTAVAAAMLVLGFAVWLVGAAFGSLPGDAISPLSAVGYAVSVGLLALACGSVAFALAPLLGRGAAAGIAAFVMVAGYLLNGYGASVPAFSGLANLTWFGWTSGHMPLSGVYDWVSLLPVAIVIVVLFAIGVELFVRRDVGASSSVRLPGLPSGLLGLGGPIQRSFGERLPTAIAWGLGLGIFAFVMGSASASLADELARLSSDTLQLFRTLFPTIDLTTAGGFLQLAFVEIGLIVVGFAAAMLVGGWASDEPSGRLETLLSTPLSRSGWVISGGIGLFAAIVVMTAVLALAVGLGAVVAGSDAVTPMLGSVVLGLYAAALAGIGMAVAGWFGASLATPVVALVVTATFLIGLIAPAMRLPDWVQQLALTAHLGQPMVGMWDGVGIGLCLVLAVGGMLLGAVGMRRRDVAR